MQKLTKYIERKKINQTERIAETQKNIKLIMWIENYIVYCECATNTQTHMHVSFRRRKIASKLKRNKHKIDENTQFYRNVLHKSLLSNQMAGWLNGRDGKCVVLFCYLFFIHLHQQHTWILLTIIPTIQIYIWNDDYYCYLKSLFLLSFFLSVFLLLLFFKLNN